MEIFSLLFLSIPFFYILGIIQLVSWFKKKPDIPQNESREQLLKRLLQELQSIKETSPQKTATEVYESYLQEFQQLQGVDEGISPQSIPQQSVAKSAPTASKESLWSRWYSTNSINLLLYVGAFFIVSSASIFVSFQWESISGVTKAMVLSLCCVAFFGCGAWFYMLPKIKNAGATFLGIGSLLIPIVGSGWYTFVFQTQMHSPGILWFITSLLSLLVYILLAYLLRTKFYSYLMTISSLSIVLSLVNIARMENTFYILGGIITSFLLLFASSLLRKYKPTAADLFSEPTSIASQFMMPTALLFGFSVGMRNDMLFSLQGTVSVLLAAVYYLCLYLQKRDAWKIGVSQLLLVLTCFLFGNWQSYSSMTIVYIVAVLALFYLGLPFTFTKARQESNWSSLIGFSLLLVLFFYGLTTNVSEIDITILSFLPALGGLLLCISTKNIQFTFVSSGFTALTLYFLHAKELVPLLKEDTSLAATYSLIGIITYAAVIMIRKHQPSIQALVSTSALYLGLGVLLSVQSPAYLTFTTLICSFTLISAAYRFTQYTLVYASALFLSISIISLLSSFDIQLFWYPIVFTGLSYALFGISFIARLPMREEISNAALGISVATPLFFGIYGRQSDEYTTDFVERNALFSAYASLILFGVYTQLQKHKQLLYILSAMGMSTYIWQLSYLSVEEQLLYTLPLGIYFIVLGFYRRVRKSIDALPLLESTGLLFALCPSLVGIFGDDTILHTVVLLALGIMLLTLGISTAQKLYKRAGIGALLYAVLAQTYDYIYQLPRWVVVGLVGVGLIGAALFLLLRRKDDQKNR